MKTDDPTLRYEHNLTFTGTSAWDDYTHSDLFGDITGAVKELGLNVGEVKFRCSPDVHAVLILHPDFLHWSKYHHPFCDQLYSAPSISGGKNVFLIEAGAFEFLIVPLRKDIFGEPNLPINAEIHAF